MKVSVIGTGDQLPVYRALNINRTTPCLNTKTIKDHTKQNDVG